MRKLVWLSVILGIIFLGCGNGAKPVTVQPDYDAAGACTLELVGDPDANVRSTDWNGEYYVSTGEYNDGMNVFSVSLTISPCKQKSISTK